MNFSDNLNKNYIYCILLIIITFTLDRISKVELINNFNENIHYVNDFINIDLIWNTGVGFGLFSSDLSLIYNSITIFIGLVILILFYIVIKSNNLDKLIYSIIIGGALGNFYDRLMYNAVPDFIDLHYNNFHWFTFNVADIFITSGIIAFLMKGFFVKNK
jgi:signal peptidase II